MADDGEGKHGTAMFIAPVDYSVQAFAYDLQTTPRWLSDELLADSGLPGGRPRIGDFVVMESTDRVSVLDAGSFADMYVAIGSGRFADRCHVIEAWAKMLGEEKPDFVYQLETDSSLVITEDGWLLYSNRGEILLRDSDVIIDAPPSADAVSISALNDIYAEVVNSDGTNGGKAIAVDGPGQTQAFIDKYVSAHPEVAKEAAGLTGVLDEVKNFQKRHPGIEDGTYDAVTGRSVDASGFCVTFHQNDSLEDPYAAYTASSYAAMSAIAKRELGATGVNIGYYGNAEVSFTCSNYDKAMKFAIEHNQESVYDSIRGEIITNDSFYNKKTNPTSNSSQ